MGSGPFVNALLETGGFTNEGDDNRDINGNDLMEFEHSPPAVLNVGVTAKESTEGNAAVGVAGVEWLGVATVNEMKQPARQRVLSFNSMVSKASSTKSGTSMNNLKTQSMYFFN